MRPRRTKIKQLDPLISDPTPVNNDSAMTETKTDPVNQRTLSPPASSPPPPSPPHPPPPFASSTVYSRFAYLCLDPTYTPDPYSRNLRWAYFMEESTATLHIAKVTIDFVGTSNFKMTVAGDMEPAAPEIVQRYASIVYTGSIYRQAYFPAQIPMVEAPVFATASSSSSSSLYVPPSSTPNHNPTPV